MSGRAVSRGHHDARRGVARAAGRRLAPLWMLLAAAAPATAAEIEVQVGNVADDTGRVLVALCTPETFLRPNCPYGAAAEARPGSTTVTLHGVLPGTYAIQAFHDTNGNRRIDRNLLGLPTEGIGFGNDAVMRFGPPDFDEAAVVVDGPHVSTALTLRYLSR